MAREFVLQGIYQWRLAGGSAGTIEAQLRQSREFIRTDEQFFTNLFKGVLSDISTLENTIQPFLDRTLSELSPVEYAILLLSTYELVHFLEVPYRAIINEAIELARTYGGSDGYKYVNGVLDKLALKIRAVEIESKK
ncbi:NusB antitermination factor [Nitrosomonas marina]|uniref:Transcription antitermination protein NusB n=1 Tax=Nitrosomonas marina TaxID=917 RepID=A0A1I0F901_9PROT|nr:transcription antitermination factor NusB [Nitrosomonas marina]SEM98684.1 NusB antitermination factor [Nitrosomonas marina]SET54472.1 NusB antitermination factor [Nitrosomonas marina]